MKKIFFLCFFVSFVKLSVAQCPVPTGLFATNITHNSALANWTPVVGVDHYRIRIREYGTTSWGNLLNIDLTMSSRLLPLLLQLTTYEWKIEAYCDSTNQFNSAWSSIDTFTTTAFVPAPFNPLLFYGMSSTLCNTHVSVTVRLIQTQNEPDIGTSIITSDGGYFDLASISVGDTIGTAELKLVIDTFLTSLVVAMKLGNLAIINSVDNSGVLGFFTIKNLSIGIEISSTTPNDNNNYTSGYTSEMIFSNLFVTPPNPGLLRFTADIESELNDPFYSIDSSTIIYCNTGYANHLFNENKKLIKTVNLLGKESLVKKNKLLFYIYNDGTVEKRIFLD